MDVLKQRKAGHGGTRKGAGRPKLTANQARIKAVTAVLKKYAQQQGKTIDEIACEMAYAIEGFEQITDTARLKAMNFLDAQRVAGGGADDSVAAFPGPAVYLPEMRPDEGKVVDIREVNDGDEESKD